ncbi:MAG: glycosyltransferase [Alphaproteobacteria bacterium]|nr:glycosyltransferase [Alphaproteobacteria bacterium]
MTKITIVTATFNLIKNNRVETFKQCLESVHNQTYKDYEHIIIDGASTDGTLAILEEYQNKGWIKYYSEPDKGIYDAMNKGIDKAQGEYIAFLNSDDFYHNPNGFSEVVKTMQNNPQAQFTYSGHIMLFEDGHKINMMPKIHKIFTRMPFCHQTMFTKTKLLKDYGKFNTNYKICADYDFIMKLALDNVFSIETPLIFTTFRQGGASDKYEEICKQDKINIYINNYDISKDEAERLLKKLNNYISLYTYLKIKIKSFLGSKL